MVSCGQRSTVPELQEEENTAGCDPGAEDGVGEMSAGLLPLSLAMAMAMGWRGGGRFGRS